MVLVSSVVAFGAYNLATEPPNDSTSTENSLGSPSSGPGIWVEKVPEPADPVRAVDPRDVERVAPELARALGEANSTEGQLVQVLDNAQEARQLCQQLDTKVGINCGSVFVWRGGHFRLSALLKYEDVPLPVTQLIAVQVPANLSAAPQLQPDEAYQRVPHVARALDRAASEPLVTVIVGNGTSTLNSVCLSISVLGIECGQPFQWRNATFIFVGVRPGNDPVRFPPPHSTSIVLIRENESEEAAVQLPPNQTYTRFPELAEALDRALEEGAERLTVTTSEPRRAAICDGLRSWKNVGCNGDRILWRGETFTLRATSTS